MRNENVRLRNRRNNYRQKFHQLKEKMIVLRIQFDQQHIKRQKFVYDSNAKKNKFENKKIKFEN